MEFILVDEYDIDIEAGVTVRAGEWLIKGYVTDQGSIDVRAHDKTGFFEVRTFILYWEEKEPFISIEPGVIMSSCLTADDLDHIPVVAEECKEVVDYIESEFIPRLREIADAKVTESISL